MNMQEICSMWGFRKLTCVIRGFAHLAENLEEATLTCASILTFVKQPAEGSVPFPSHCPLRRAQKWCL